MNSCKTLIITKPGSRRHNLVAAHLEEKGFSALVSSAVFLESSDEFPCEYDQQTRNRLLGYDLTIGEIGCFMAHRKAWKQVVLLDRACLILEDDARVRPTFSPAALQEIADAIAGKKIVVRLFSQRHSSTKKWRVLASGLQIVRPSKPGYSAVAYLLDPAAAAALLQSSTRFWQTVDNHIDSEPDHACVVMHVLPELVSHDDEGNSLIGERHKPRLSLLFRLRREWLRALRNSRLAWHREKTLWSLGLRCPRRK